MDARVKPAHDSGASGRAKWSATTAVIAGRDLAIHHSRSIMPLRALTHNALAPM
jgi:hypothetical protein